MGFSYNVNVLNQKGSPAIYTDTFANRPPFGFAGRLFVANDTSAIYEDTGTSWVLIANVSSGAGTLQQVTTNGNTSNVGISVTAGGVSTNSLTVTSLTPGSVPFAGTAGLITQDNPNLFWDDTNNRLGINTNTPTNNLDVHGSGTIPLLALNNTAGNQSFIGFVNNSVAKWRIGNSSTNNFDIFNVGLTSNAISISSASNSVSFLASIKIQQAAGFAGIAGYNGIGCDAGGFFFQLGTSNNIPYFNFIGLTGAQSYTYPNATGTIALTSDLSAYLPLSGGTLTGSLSTSPGVPINANSGALLIPPSSTRGVINLGGTTDNFLTFADKGYIGVGQTTMQVLALSGVALSFASNGATVMSFGTTTGNCSIGSTVDDTVNKLQVTGSGIADSFKLSSTRTTAILNIDVNLNLPKIGIDIKTLQSPSGGAFIQFTNLSDVACGSITHTTATTVAYNTLSDYRLKKDLKDFNGIDLVNSIKVYDFEWIEDKKRMYGLIAHELQQILPYAVTGEKDGEKMQGLDYSFLTPILTKAIQDQQKIIESLIKRIELLENK
jgi:hypothetical protein